MENYSNPFLKSDYEALAEFRHALRRFLHFAEQGAREAGITPQQHQLLLAIMGQPGRDWGNVTEIAEALQLSHHGAVGLVNRCVKLDLVRRTRAETDRRQVRVVLTERGRELLERLTERNRAELQALRGAFKV